MRPRHAIRRLSTGQLENAKICVVSAWTVSEELRPTGIDPRAPGMLKVAVIRYGAMKEAFVWRDSAMRLQFSGGLRATRKQGACRESAHRRGIDKRYATNYPAFLAAAIGRSGPGSGK
jgi:hypothetical protein